MMLTSIFRYSKNYGSLTHETRIKDAVNMEDLISLLATLNRLQMFSFFFICQCLLCQITFTGVLLDHTATVCCFVLLRPNCLWCWFAFTLVFGLFLIIFVCLFVLCVCVFFFQLS